MFLITVIEHTIEEYYITMQQYKYYNVVALNK